MSKIERPVTSDPEITRQPSKMESIMSATGLRRHVVETKESETMTLAEYRKLVKANEKWKASLSGTAGETFVKSKKVRALIAGGGVIAVGALSFAAWLYASGDGDHRLVDNPNPSNMRSLDTTPPFKTPPEVLLQGFVGDGIIQNSGELSQQDMKMLLDRADGEEDGYITLQVNDDGEVASSAIEEIFEEVGADGDDLEKYEEFFRESIKKGEITDSLTPTGSVELDTNDMGGLGFGADAAALIARSAKRDLPAQTDKVVLQEGFVEDRTVDLIDLLEAKSAVLPGSVSGGRAGLFTGNVSTVSTGKFSTGPIVIPNIANLHNKAASDQSAMAPLSFDVATRGESAAPEPNIRSVVTESGTARSKKEPSPIKSDTEYSVLRFDAPIGPLPLAFIGNNVDYPSVRLYTYKDDESTSEEEGWSR